MSSTHQAVQETVLIIPSPKTMWDKAYAWSWNRLSNLAEMIASKQVGQIIFRRVDDVFWTIEKSIEWSVPSVPAKVDKDKTTVLPGNGVLEKSTNGSTPNNHNRCDPEERVRPLPWVFFIPLLTIIRGVRLCLEVTSSFLKKEPVKPKAMVRYVQALRRRLRVLKCRGLRRQEDAVVTPQSTLSSLATYIPLFRAVHDTQAQAAETTSVQPKEKRKFAEINADSSESGDDDETVEAKLNRLAQEDDDNENDPDYEPHSSLDTNPDDSSCDDSDESDVDPNRSPSKSVIPRQGSTISNDIIEEENEDAAESSTMSISDDDDDDEENVDVVNDSKTASIDRDKFYSPLHSDVEADQTEVALKPIAFGGDTSGGLESQEDEVAQVDNVKSDYESCSLSLSTKSENVVITSAESSVCDLSVSEHSNDSAMQKLANFFPKRKKETSKTSV